MGPYGPYWAHMAPVVPARSHSSSDAQCAEKIFTVRFTANPKNFTVRLTVSPNYFHSENETPRQKLDSLVHFANFRFHCEYFLGSL